MIFTLSSRTFSTTLQARLKQTFKMFFVKIRYQSKILKEILTKNDFNFYIYKIKGSKTKNRI